MTATDDPLVSTEWLAAHLGDPKVKLLDASFKLPGVLPLPRDDYRTAHIPGAAFFDVDVISDHGIALPHMFPSEGDFAEGVGALGIGNDDTVVVYDAGGWVAGPRAWWMFLAFGHRDVRVLDGGMQKWRAEGRPVESGETFPDFISYSASFHPNFVRNRSQLVDNLDSRVEQVVDARPQPRFEGSVPEPRPGLRAGHIPGARSVPYAGLFDSKTGLMKPLDELRSIFAAAGVALDKPIVTSCGSGVSALVLTLALYRLGVRGTALYDGSWAEWGMADGPPVATGAA
jgi:thiosulfate/3-mercaptopyruvate sulfurtransferase